MNNLKSKYPPLNILHELLRIDYFFPFMLQILLKVAQINERKKKQWKNSQKERTIYKS